MNQELIRQLNELYFEKMQLFGKTPDPYQEGILHGIDISEQLVNKFILEGLFKPVAVPDKWDIIE